MIDAVKSVPEANKRLFDSVHYLRDNQLEALKSLAMLLLREVEALQKTPSDTNSVLEEERLNLYDRIQQFEVDLIRAALIKTNGSQRKAAKLLGTKETTLCVKIKRYGIDLANQHSNSDDEKNAGDSEF